MLKKMGNWFKGHRILGLMLPVVMALMLTSVMVVPYAMAALEYVDVRGTYKVSSTIPAKYLDGSKHPNIPAGNILTITTQTNQAISVASLTMPGKTVSLTGLVGPGNRPYISLTGNDTVGTYVTINGRVNQRFGSVTGISGRIEGFVTSDGEKGLAYDSDGSAAHSTVAAYSGAYSALLTAGTVDQSSVFIQFNNPSTRLTVRNLSRLTTGLSFYHKFENTEVCGPQIELRFIAPTCTDPDGAGHVDITVHPLESAIGDGTWKQLVITSDSTPVSYFGNDPVDGTGFFKIGTAGPLTGTLALIDAETAMTAHGASASKWKLSRVRIELWDDMDDGERTCYIDDVQIDRTTYTLEPTRFSGTLNAKKQ